MKATVLVDNVGDNGLPGEWGLSIFIDYMDYKILLDVGASKLFAENAKKLGVYLIPHHTDGLEEVGKREMMYQKTSTGLHPDNFSHEQSLVFETENGLVIFNSCSHGGVINIINEVSKCFPGQKVYGIIGGFHLFNKPEDEIRALAKKIKDTGIQYVCTGHCTKDRATRILKEELGDMVHQFHVGLEMNF